MRVEVEARLTWECQRHAVKTLPPADKLRERDFITITRRDCSLKTSQARARHAFTFDVFQLVGHRTH